MVGEWRREGGESYKYVCCASYLQFVRIEYSFKRSIVSLPSAGAAVAGGRKRVGAGRSVLSWHSYLTPSFDSEFPTL